MRLGQIHRAGPAALDQLRQIGRLLLGRAVQEDRRDRALRQRRIHGKGHVGRRHELVDGDRHRRRQALAAELGRRRNAHPAAFGVLLVGGLEAVRRGDAAVGVARAALLVADAIERLHHLLAELGGFRQDRLDRRRARRRQSPAGCCSARSGRRRSGETASRRRAPCRSARESPSAFANRCRRSLAPGDRPVASHRKLFTTRSKAPANSAGTLSRLRSTAMESLCPSKSSAA